MKTEKRYHVYYVETIQELNRDFNPRDEGWGSERYITSFKSHTVLDTDNIKEAMEVGQEMSRKIGKVVSVDDTTMTGMFGRGACTIMECCGNHFKLHGD